MFIVTLYSYVFIILTQPRWQWHCEKMFKGSEWLVEGQVTHSQCIFPMLDANHKTSCVSIYKTSLTYDIYVSGMREHTTWRVQRVHQDARPRRYEPHGRVSLPVLLPRSQVRVGGCSTRLGPHATRARPRRGSSGRSVGALVCLADHLHAFSQGG